MGVGVAYPFDTLKTKSQVYGERRRQRRQDRQGTKERTQLRLEGGDITDANVAKGMESVTTLVRSGTPGMERSSSLLSSITMELEEKIIDDVLEEYNNDDDDDDDTSRAEGENLVSLMGIILKNEGISGFFGGVRAMMIGQALIKSVAFSANELALGVLNGASTNSAAVVAVTMGGGLEDTVVGTSTVGVSVTAAVAVAATTSSFVTLILAAAFSGFVTSFLVAPVERVKVMMQAQQNSMYANELECIQAVLKNEGWGGLLTRGLGPTLAREVPSYAIYFVVYRLLMTSLEGGLGNVAPLVCGAMSGCACWVPVYPIDVVKTLVQNTEGEESSESAIDVARQLYRDEGIGAFFNGLTPKMVRASVNHAVTFWVYDLVMDLLI